MSASRAFAIVIAVAHMRRALALGRLAADFASADFKTVQTFQREVRVMLRRQLDEGELRAPELVFG